MSKEHRQIYYSYWKNYRVFILNLVFFFKHYVVASLLPTLFSRKWTFYQDTEQATRLLPSLPLPQNISIQRYVLYIMGNTRIHPFHPCYHCLQKVAAYFVSGLDSSHDAPSCRWMQMRLLFPASCPSRCWGLERTQTPTLLLHGDKWSASPHLAMIYVHLKSSKSILTKPLPCPERQQLLYEAYTLIELRWKVPWLSESSTFVSSREFEDNSLSLWVRQNVNESHAENLKPLQPLGQKYHAAHGSTKAMIIEEKRFTALLSNMGFPDMCLESFVWWLTTMPIFSSKPGKR